MVAVLSGSIILAQSFVPGAAAVLRQLTKLNSVCMPMRYLWVFAAYIALRNAYDTIPAEYRFVKNQAVAKFFGGWCFARNHYRAKAQAALPPPVAAPVVKPEQKMPVQAAVPKTAAIQKQQAKDTPVQEKQGAPDRVTISKADMHKLVQSARVELSNSK